MVFSFTMDALEENDSSIGHRSDAEHVRKRLHDICNWTQLDNVAIEYHDLRQVIYITYGEIFRAKNMVSDYFKCLKDRQFIGINFDMPEYCVASLMLGILDAGHSFVNMPLDAANFAHLQGRLNIQYVFAKEITIQGDITCTFMVHGKQIYLISLKHTRQQITPAKGENSYAYAISTSGTTRTPKVVKVSHSCIVPNIVDLSKILKINNCDKICQFTNFTFDPSIVEIFLALSNSASLFVASKALQSDPNRLLEKAYSSQVTVLQTTPSVFLYNWTTERLRSSILSNNTVLRAILLGGEPFPRAELLVQIKHTQNDTKFYNIFGITEVSCWASINEVVLTNSKNDAHCLGQALSHTMLQVRNETGKIITSGTGSLYIGSNRRICVVDDESVEELELPLFRDTGDVVDIVEDGRIFYRGRRNSIVKRFGNKVDTSILEEFMLQTDLIKGCHVIWDNDYHKLHLCLITEEKVTDYHDLNSNVMNHLCNLHHLYRPDKIHFLDHVEFTPSGKVSLEFLRGHCRREENAIGSVKNVESQEVENTFKSIWKDNLRCVNDGFVKLGGTSVMALQMSNAVCSAVNMEFPELIGMLLMDSTFDECLSYIRSVVSSNFGTKADFTLEKSGAKIEVPLVNTIVIKDTVSLERLERQKQNSVPPIPVDQFYTCEWYKCRGRKCTNCSDEREESNVRYDAISNVEVSERYDLEKCVDASPTVFRCSDGKTYATVGSHSGLIFTFGLEKDCSSGFKIRLPDRVEASILILENFRGVVGCYDGNVYCLDLKTGDIIWKYKTEDVVKCTAIACVERKTIFVGSYDCYVYCLSAKDGGEIWRNKCSNGSIKATGCLHSLSRTVLFGSLDGSCLALEQSSGSVVWRRTLPDPIFVAPVSLSNGLVIFCTVTGLLCCFDIEINVKLWTYKIHGNIFSYLVLGRDAPEKCESIIVASRNKNVYCLQLEDGNLRSNPPTLKYVLSFHSAIFATPWFENNCLFLTCIDGTLNIYNRLANRLVRIEKLPGEVFSSPVVEGNAVIIGCRDNNVYVLQLV